MYGQEWIKFISNCKATLGTESGASIIDFTGRSEYKINRFQAFRPFAHFKDVPAKLLEDDGKLEIQVISPRCFEATALQTVMVLYPGSYSNILIKDKHYIELKKDFSNFDEVYQKLKDSFTLYNRYMKFNFFKSLIYTFILSINFIFKNY